MARQMRTITQIVLPYFPPLSYLNDPIYEIDSIPLVHMKALKCSCDVEARSSILSLGSLDGP